MLDPRDFRSRWATEDGSPLVMFSVETTATLAIAPEAKAFLNRAGLPASAAPFLDFRSPPSGPLPTAAQLWRVSSDLAALRVIGTSGQGDLVCLDEERAGEVVVLRQSDDHARLLMNSSVSQLAESLLYYRSFVRRAEEHVAAEDESPTGSMIELRRLLAEELQGCDPSACVEGTFWSQELQNLG